MSETQGAAAAPAEPWRAAWMAFIAVTDPDRDLTLLAEDDEADPQWRAAWEAAAQAADREITAHYESVISGYRDALCAMQAERDDYVGALAALMARIAGMAAGMAASARATEPSRKSEIEARCAKALRDLLANPGASPDAAAGRDAAT